MTRDVYTICSSNCESLTILYILKLIQCLKNTINPLSNPLVEMGWQRNMTLARKSPKSGTGWGSGQDSVADNRVHFHYLNGKWSVTSYVLDDFQLSGASPGPSFWE